jgi:DNA-directed RNA polymerase subunit RPC12/RpoP
MIKYMEKTVVAECKVCGSRSSIVWKKDRKCPSCSSLKIYPVVTVGESLSEEEQKIVAEKLRQKRGIFLVFSGLILFSVILGFLGYRKHEYEQTHKEFSYWVCENCKAGYIDESALSPKKCRECKTENLIRAVKYKCLLCETLFEAYRTKDTDERGIWYIKQPGTDWIQLPSEKDFRASIQCPSCGSKNLKRMIANLKKD